MNVPPKEFTRVMPDGLRTFITAIFQKAGTSNEDAAFMANLLVLTDLRGVFSHGTRQTPGYVQMMLDGKVNPRPNVSVVDDTPTTAIFDGDGGMGHFPAYRAAKAVVQKAKTMGLGAATTRNHFHFGGAGKYSRLALEANCIGFATSAHRFRPNPESSVLTASGASPMSFAIPAGENPPIVIDMGNWVDYDGPIEEGFARLPATFFKTLGLGAVCHALGGFMAGIWLFDKPPGPGIWEGANQGAFIMAIDIARFIPIEDFKRNIDRHISEIRQMKPAPGLDRADLPGTLEWEREREWAEDGIPMSQQHQDSLTTLADQLGVPTPF